MEEAPLLQPGSPRVPLPPPIIPETEDSTPSPVSETSSGYISTSISTATLSDIYTLSWDLPLQPVASSRRTDGFETEEQSSAAEPWQAHEALLVWDPEKAGPDSGPSPRSREGPPQAGHEPDWKPKLENQQSAQAPERHLQEGAPGGVAPIQVPEETRASAPVFLSAAETEAAPEVPNSNVPDAVAAEAPPPPPAPPQTRVQPPKATAGGTSPFKIQKVKSSDLKSFQPILGAEEADGGGGGGLAAPLESLEIISDSEGDAAAVLPDWLKEGEFVSVGGNKSGTVRYVGPADFADGTWVGVELDVPAGEWKNRTTA